MWLGDETDFPEAELPELVARPSTGLCLSGGGTRATCAAIGYLRGLFELGLLGRLRYTSAVSGGSWASVPFTFWQQGADDDRELLGPLVAPEQLDGAELQAEIPARGLSFGPTQTFRTSLFDDVATEGPGDAWISATGETFLERGGLYQPEAPRSYAWSETTLAELLARQAELPGARLRTEDFVLARPGRPFPIVNATLLGPAVGGTLSRLQPVGFQFTPLYAGSRPALDIDYAYPDGRERTCPVGGGFVEPFALTGAGPGWLAADSVQTPTLERPELLSDLAFAIGTSSCAYASVFAEHLALPKRLTGRVPIANYWPPRAGDVPTSASWEFGDGGVIDNYGLLPLLQRGVETIIVAINTKQKLSVDWTPGEGSYQPHIDPYLPPLFGVHEQRKSIALERNQVFPREELAGLVIALQAAKIAGDPLIAVREHQVLDNEWWGIRGGRKVRIAWIYLDRVARFEERLPGRTQHAIELGNGPVAAGPLPGFPNYETIGANRFSLVRLEPAQIRLLTNLCAWTILDQRDLFEGLV